MELFAPEHQHDPVWMLSDLVTLYALHYGVDPNYAISMLRDNAQRMKVPYTKKNPNPSAASPEALERRAQIEAAHQAFLRSNAP